MNTQEIVKKLAELLYNEDDGYNGIICFDWRTYVDENDIPHIIINGERVNINEFRVNKEGTQISVISGDDSYTLDLTTSPFTEQEYEDMGIDTLLHDVYYETIYSWKIGDFEIDFLGII